MNLINFSAFGQDDTSTKVLRVKKLIQEMTIEQRVGQLFLVGFSGLTPEDGLRSIIRDVKPGGILFFSRNIKSARQTSKLIFRSQVYAQTQARVPMFVAVDQEGGFVSRIRLNPPLPSALSIALSNDTDLVDRMGYYTGLLLSSLGFNMNLAPVLDTIHNDEKSFIGNRAFGFGAAQTAQMAHAFAHGLTMAKIVPTFKHFPGHGGGYTDSHLAMPVRMDSIEQLDKNDWAPYRNINQYNPVAIMAAHISFPSVDSSRLPATFSSVLLKDILRDKLGFEGIIITDDIEMRGANDSSPLGERAVQSFLAGADMIMIAWNRSAQKSAVKTMIKAVNSGDISESRLNQSLERILLAKNELGLLEDIQVPKLKTYRSLILSRSVSDLSYKIIKDVFTQSTESFSHDISGAGSYPYLLFSSRNAFHNYFKQKYSHRTLHFGLSEMSRQNIDRQFKIHHKSFGVVYIASQQLANVVNVLSPATKKRLMVINGFGPGVLNQPNSFMSVHNIYTSDARIGFVLAEWLSNKLQTKPLEFRLPAAQLE
ncbi:MAG: glycoside hydrolase family 3 protein [Pseudomonadota bacterium]|nr:glycoside hydrolase family 3 protein [Pseudomonadota bacterium]